MHATTPSSGNSGRSAGLAPDALWAASAAEGAFASARRIRLVLGESWVVEMAQASPGGPVVCLSPAQDGRFAVGACPHTASADTLDDAAAAFWQADALPDAEQRLVVCLDVEAGAVLDAAGLAALEAVLRLRPAQRGGGAVESQTTLSIGRAPCEAVVQAVRCVQAALGEGHQDRGSLLLLPTTLVTWGELCVWAQGLLMARCVPWVVARVERVDCGLAGELGFGVSSFVVSLAHPELPRLRVSGQGIPPRRPPRGDTHAAPHRLRRHARPCRPP